VLTSAKVPSTPREPAAAVGTAIDRAQLGGAIDRLVHGTTVATNVILQRQGARLCLLTTASFEDLPYIQRINRPLAYSLRWRRPKPLVRRRMIVGVHERIDPSGAVVEPLTESECERVVALVRTLVERDGVEAVAICLLFSSLNDSHERALENRLAAELPTAPVSRSSRISPIWREYERMAPDPSGLRVPRGFEDDRRFDALELLGRGAASPYDLPLELSSDRREALRWKRRSEGSRELGDQLLVHSGFSGNARNIDSTYSTKRTLASSIWSR
jgi:Hydantoinase/oxoprolinase N-terminal region